MSAFNSPEDFLLAEYVMRNVRRKPRRRIRSTNYYATLDDREFFNRFRLSKKTARRVLGEVQLTSNSVRSRTSITNEEKLLLTLRFLASGSFLICMGDFLGIDKGTVSRIIAQVICKIAKLGRRYINMPKPGERQCVNTGFYSMARFPRVIGAIDCCHIGIQSPGGENAELFRNRKGVFSINCQMVVDHTLSIRNITAHHPGSVHDQNIVEGSWLKIQFDRGDFGDSILLGDAGYTCSRWLLTPVPRPTSQGERLYNESLIRTRNTVERAFGVLKRRFPVLNKIRLLLPKVEAVVVACAVLHNICVLEKDTIEEREEAVEMPEHVGYGNYTGNYSVRNEMINYFEELL